MAIPKKNIGSSGEEKAIKYLEQNGFCVLERNFHNKLGEIDIIARDRDVLCFIEVKTRRSDRFGSPFEAITPFKQKRLIRLALSYMQMKNLKNTKARFDVIGIYCPPDQESQVRMIKNAFEQQDMM